MKRNPIKIHLYVSVHTGVAEVAKEFTLSRKLFPTDFHQLLPGSTGGRRLALLQHASEVQAGERQVVVVGDTKCCVCPWILLSEESKALSSQGWEANSLVHRTRSEVGYEALPTSLDNSSWNVD